jgi:dihydrodipicolinate reductase
MKTKILLSGALGKMGRLVYETAQSSEQYEITAVVDIKNIGEDIGELLDALRTVLSFSVKHLCCD